MMYNGRNNGVSQAEGRSAPNTDWSRPRKGSYCQYKQEKFTTSTTLPNKPAAQSAQQNKSPYLARNPQNIPIDNIGLLNRKSSMSNYQRQEDSKRYGAVRQPNVPSTYQFRGQKYGQAQYQYAQPQAGYQKKTRDFMYEGKMNYDAPPSSSSYSEINYERRAPQNQKFNQAPQNFNPGSIVPAVNRKRQSMRDNFLAYEQNGQNLLQPQKSLYDFDRGDISRRDRKRQLNFDIPQDQSIPYKSTRKNYGDQIKKYDRFDKYEEADSYVPRRQIQKEKIYVPQRQKQVIPQYQRNIQRDYVPPVSQNYEKRYESKYNLDRQKPYYIPQHQQKIDARNQVVENHTRPNINNITPSRNKSIPNILTSSYSNLQPLATQQGSNLSQSRRQSLIDKSKALHDKMNELSGGKKLIGSNDVQKIQNDINYDRLERIRNNKQRVYQSPFKDKVKSSVDLRIKEHELSGNKNNSRNQQNPSNVLQKTDVNVNTYTSIQRSQQLMKKLSNFTGNTQNKSNFSNNNMKNEENKSFAPPLPLDNSNSCMNRINALNSKINEKINSLINAYQKK